MKLWSVNRSTAPAPQPETEADPVRRDRPIGLFEAVGLSTGVKTIFRSNVPVRHFAWLFSIRQLQPAMSAMGDEALQQSWARIKERAKETSIQSVLPEAFALMREISRRTMNEEPYEVQLLTAMGLLSNRIVQMKTGEGKSLAIVLAASLAALEGKGVHVIAESTDSAERDSQRYRKLYQALGLTAGIIKDAHQYEPSTVQKEKRAAYAADVTYGFADNFIFDRLQDATSTEARMRVQRPPAYAIVDEADNVLLDIAQQPVILAEIAPEPNPAWEADLKLADAIGRELALGKHFEVRHENERRLVSLTASGFEAVEAALRKSGRAMPKEGLAHPTQYPFYHALRQALVARYALRSDKHYIGDGVLVNQHNGRAQPLSRFFHGASDAVAMLRNKPLEGHHQVVGQTSYQDFFTTYPHLSGVTGTLEGTHSELFKVYGLQAVEIPTRLPSKLVIEPEEVFVNEFLDRAASVAKVLDAHHTSDRPVLFPAVTVEQSKMLTERLKDPLLALADAATSSVGLLLAAADILEGGQALADKWLAKDLESGRDEARQEILDLLRADRSGSERFVDFLEEHGFSARALLGPPASPSLVNAENADHLAIYVARAGKPNHLTVTTLMGRATDVQPKHDDGLLVICYGHRSSRRDDLQVAGRAGRQGKPGTVQFFTSLNDDTLSGLPARLLRGLRQQLTDRERLRPTPRQRNRVMRAIKRAQERIGLQAEVGRIHRAKLDRIVAEKRLRLDQEKREILERTDLHQVMESWVQLEVARSLIRNEMMREADHWSPKQLEAFAKRELNECWILTGKEAAAILKDAGVPPISDDLDAQIPLETLFEHAGIDPSSRTNLAKGEAGIAICRATAHWKLGYEADGMSHKEIERMLAHDSEREIDPEELAKVFAGIGLSIEPGKHRLADLEELVHEALRPIVSQAVLGLVEDRPSISINQRVRELLLTNINRIFCDFLERESSYQENLAGMAAFAELDPTVEYWKRAAKEFDRMQADVQRTTSRAFVAELNRLAPLAASSEVPAELEHESRIQLETFFSSLDALTFNLDPNQFAASRCEDQARAFVDGLTKTPARLFGSMLHPVLDLMRDYQVGLVRREDVHRSLLELRLSMFEEARGWPETVRRTVMEALTKEIPRLDRSPALQNPKVEDLYARLTIDEMMPRSIMQREAGLRADGTKLLLEEFLVGRVKSADHPLIRSAVAQLEKEGGSVYALAAQDRERRNWLQHRAPPFFVTEDGTPYIAIDLTRNGAIEALAHELRHFVRWRERRDQLVKGGMPSKEAAGRALAIENEPENLIQGETECVAEELRVQKLPVDWNISSQPTKPEEPGYISRMAYPRIQGLRMLLWKEKDGEAVGDRPASLMRELVDLAVQVRSERSHKIAEAIATERDPDRLLRLQIQDAVFSSKSLFEEIFNKFDRALFTSNDTEERLIALFDQVAGAHQRKAQ